MDLLPMQVLQIGRGSLLLLPAKSDHTQYLQRHGEAEQFVDVVTRRHVIGIEAVAYLNPTTAYTQLLSL